MDFSKPQGPIFTSQNASDGEVERRYFLVADDNEGDRILLKKALEDNHIEEEIRFVNGGMELVELLKQCKSTLLFPAGAFPCLILLDLYMPRMDGHQTLKIIKDDMDLRKIPVIILTASHTLEDVTQSYHDGANSFLTKPLEYDRLVALLGLIKQYWLEESRLPA
jgi:two-component system response regulator